MRYDASKGEQPATGMKALEEVYNNQDLTRLVRNYCGPKPPTRKDQLLAQLQPLLSREHLRKIWPGLDPLIRDALAEMAWDEEGRLRRSRFKAKYGRMPPQDVPDKDPKPGRSMYDYGGRNRGASILEVLAPGDVMARDVQKRLREFVPEPEPAKVKVTDPLPDHVDQPTWTWDPKTRTSEKGTEAVPLARRDMERSAARDLAAVLRLVDVGKVAITEKNRWPTPAAMRAVARVLDGGDYYMVEPPKEEKKESKKSSGKKGDDDYEYEEDEEEKAGPIRAFAWPVVLQAGKLAQVSGSRLALTKAGRAALAAPAHETLRELWRAWLGSDLLDEFRRVNAIRGQSGKGGRGMTAPAKRRTAIAAALAECPAGQWVLVDDFSRYMRAAEHGFKVTNNPWRLYLAELHYGSLENANEWRTFQLRYLLAFLMEYAGTLGLLDLAYLPPAGARDDYTDLWGADDLPYLSRYDGLLYFRVNALGAYCLGSTDAYAPPPAEVRHVLSVKPDLTVVVPDDAAGGLTAADNTMLETFAEQTGKGAKAAWRLDRDKTLAAAAGGREVREFVEFLESAGGEELPDAAAEFFEDVEQRLRALADLGRARVIGCNAPGLAEFLAADPTVQKLCHRLGDSVLVVPEKSEPAFLRALRKLGYVLPAAGGAEGTG